MDFGLANTTRPGCPALWYFVYQGQAPIWGKKPEYIVATYQAPNGKKSTSLLLSSGWWGTRYAHGRGVAREWRYAAGID